MKGISCFSRKSIAQDLDNEAPRTPRKKGRISRQGSNQSQASRCSTASNSSISRLPPCKRVSDPHIEAMMMPVPPEARQSRCLRMSHPKIYSNIVDDMKKTRKSRAWKDFQVFHTDEVDMTISAVEVAAKKAAQYERMVRDMHSFDDSSEQRKSGSSPGLRRPIPSTCRFGTPSHLPRVHKITCPRIHLLRTPESHSASWLAHDKLPASGPLIISLLVHTSPQLSIPSSSTSTSHGMINSTTAPPASTLPITKKRHDTVLGLSESPPWVTSQQRMHSSRPRNASISSDESIKSDSTTSSTRRNFHQGLLMSEGTPDPDAKAKQAHYRRRMRRHVFNDAYLDWKSAPVVCDETYDYASLLYRKDLRCQASQQYLLQVQDELRRIATAEAIRGSESTVCVDGEEMVDMIG